MNSNSTQIDTKLQHLIHKIIKTTSSPSSPLSSKQLLDTLLTKHREYKRKNSTILQTNVDEILIQFAKSKKLNTSVCSKSGSLVIGGSTGGNNKKKSVRVPIGQQHQQQQQQQQQQVGVVEGKNDQNNLGSKRKRSEDQVQQDQGQEQVQKRINHSSDEEEYDKAAAQNDIIVQSHFNKQDEISSEIGSGSGSSSMLNANLRNRYKDVQRGRDIVARKKATIEEQENANQSSIDDQGNDQTTSPSSSFLPGISESFSKDDTGNVITPTSRPSTPLSNTRPPTPTKKKKKKLSKSSSSNSLSKAGSGGGGGGSFPSEQSSAFMTTPTPRPNERYSDLGGLSKTLTQIRQLIEYPLSHPELFSHLGIHPPRGVLLRGPPGCGKTHIANAIAGQLNVTFFKISAPEIVSSMSGESESRVRDLFSIASSSAPSIIFMDEIDAIAPKRGGDGSSSGGAKGMEKRIVAQLLTCMDSLAPENNRNGSPVMVLAATNRPDSIDSALRRAGRFDREIILGVPDEEGRENILRVMTVGMRLSGDINFKLLAKKTPGFVGADIRSLTKEAGVIAINRIFKRVLIGEDPTSSISEESSKRKTSLNLNGNTDADESMIEQSEEEVKDNGKQDGSNEKQIVPAQQPDTFDIHSVTPFTPEQMEPLSITMNDFLSAVPHVQPSSQREGFATVPDVSWENIGALQSIREELTLSVLEPITHPEKFKALGLPLPAGVLLYGPPGCGKVSFMMIFLSLDQIECLNSAFLIFILFLLYY